MGKPYTVEDGSYYDWLRSQDLSDWMGHRVRHTENGMQIELLRERDVVIVEEELHHNSPHYFLYDSIRHDHVPIEHRMAAGVLADARQNQPPRDRRPNPQAKARRRAANKAAGKARRQSR